MLEAYLDDVQKPEQSVNALFSFLGVVVDEIGPEQTVLSLVAKDELMQGAGILAGGIISTLLDESMAHVVLANLEPGVLTATVEMSTRFFKPVRRHDAVRAVASVIKKGRTMVHVEAEMFNQADMLVAKSSGSFIILNKGA